MLPPFSDSVWTNVIVTLIISVITFLVYTKWWTHTYWTRMGIPQIQPNFLLGSAYDTLKNKENLAMTIAKLHAEIKNKGLKYCGVYFFTKPILIVSDLEVIKTILVKDFDHFEDRDLYKNEKDDPLSSHLLTQDGEKWRSMRRKLTPTFTSGQLKWMFDILLDSNKYVPNILDKHVDGDPRLGMKITSEDVEKFFMGVIKESVKLREEKTIYRKDFMQLLVEMKEKDGITLEDIAAQAFLFFLAAFDTTSNTLAFAMAEISRNQHIQDRLRKEILSVLDKYDGKITYDAINEMEYLNCVLEETLRKYCPAPALERKCTKDYTIPNTNHLIKKGILVAVSNFAIHQDPEYYPDPEVFDPERFSEENRKKIPQMAYIPFGAGPRNCIGLRFGRMQSKVVLCSLLKDYRFTLNGKTVYPINFYPHSIVLTSKEQIWLDVHKL